jgi:hypothetical protein
MEMEMEMEMANVWWFGTGNRSSSGTACTQEETLKMFNSLTPTDMPSISNFGVSLPPYLEHRSSVSLAKEDTQTLVYLLLDYF